MGGGLIWGEFLLLIIDDDDDDDDLVEVEIEKLSVLVMVLL